MLDRLFVYGTLVPGRSNAHQLESIVGTWAPASVTGTLLPDGWAGYPGVVLDPAGPAVPGFLLTSPDLPEHWERLDVFEGDGYDRVTADVLLEDGSTTTAQTYVLRTYPDLS